MDTQFAGLVEEKLVRNLNEQPCAITRISFGPYSAPVLHTPEHLKRVGYDLVRLAAFDVSHKANAAVVMFKLGTVQADIGLNQVFRPLLSLYSSRLVNLIRHGRNSVGLIRRFCLYIGELATKGMNN